MEYNKKYDAHNEGTRFVFNKFYSILSNSGIKSNMVACCGRDYKTYEKYADMICRTPKAVAYFFENDPKRFNDIKEGIKSEKVLVRLGSVLHYSDYGVKAPCRVEDIGIGLGIRWMIAQATGRLHIQSRMRSDNRYKWKAQILDSALRSVSDVEVVQLYQNYLFTVGLHIKRINGKDPCTPNILGKENSNILKTYGDSKVGQCNVYHHEVELEKNNRQATLLMTTCINGSRMLQSLLMYK